MGGLDKWHLSEAQSHSRLTQCPLFFPAEFIEQFKEHLNQRKWTFRAIYKFKIEVGNTRNQTQRIHAAKAKNIFSPPTHDVRKWHTFKFRLTPHLWIDLELFKTDFWIVLHLLSFILWLAHLTPLDPRGAVRKCYFCWRVFFPLEKTKLSKECNLFLLSPLFIIEFFGVFRAWPIRKVISH